MAVSVINQHEIFSFEYTHHLLLLLPPSSVPKKKRVRGVWDMLGRYVQVILVLNQKLKGGLS